MIGDLVISLDFLRALGINAGPRLRNEKNTVKVTRLMHTVQPDPNLTISRPTLMRASRAFLRGLHDASRYGGRVEDVFLLFGG